MRFQNISCYCLTTTADESKTGEVVFQNISCYCLTWLSFNLNWQAKRISKHLMLLFNQRKIVIFKQIFYKKERFYKLFQYFYHPPLLILTFLEKQRILAVFTTFSKNHLVKYQKLHFPMFLNTSYYESNQSNMQP